MHIEIVGAGISVFYIALLLGREVRDVTIFEASDRVGGHIYTRGFPPQAGAEDIYFEAGAMCIPRLSLRSRIRAVHRGR